MTTKKVLFLYNREKQRRSERILRDKGEELSEDNILEEYKKLGGKYEYQIVSVPAPKKTTKKSKKKRKSKKKKK